MLIVQRVVVGIMQENAYIVYNENKKALLIDPGDEFHKIKKIVDDLGLDIQAILLTHGHFDHFGRAKEFQDLGLKVYIHKDDSSKLTSKLHSLAALVNQDINKVVPDVTFDKEIEFDVSDFHINVIFTPGHTMGSVCYIINNEIMFSGDTLFYRSYGRYDFPDGSKEMLYNSIVNKLFKIKDNLKIYPGHDDATFLLDEKNENPAYSLND